MTSLWENEVRNKAKTAIEKCNGLCFIIHGHMFQGAGWPDVHIVHRRFTGWIEWKRDFGELSEVQRIIGRRLVERGTKAMVFYYDNMNEHVYPYSFLEFGTDKEPQHMGIAINLKDCQKVPKVFIDFCVDAWRVHEERYGVQGQAIP